MGARKFKPVIKDFYFDYSSKSVGFDFQPLMIYFSDYLTMV